MIPPPGGADGKMVPLLVPQKLFFMLLLVAGTAEEGACWCSFVCSGQASVMPYVPDSGRYGS